MVPMITRRHANEDDEKAENVSGTKTWMPETCGWMISSGYAATNLSSCSKPAVMVFEALKVRNPQSNLQSTPPTKEGYAVMVKTGKKRSAKGAETPK